MSFISELSEPHPGIVGLSPDQRLVVSPMNGSPTVSMTNRLQSKRSGLVLGDTIDNSAELTIAESIDSKHSDVTDATLCDARRKPRDGYLDCPLTAYSSLTQSDIDWPRQISERIRFVLDEWATEIPQKSSTTRHYDRPKSLSLSRFIIDTLRKVLKYGCGQVTIRNVDHPSDGGCPRYPRGYILLAGPVSPSSGI
jgi:hypothetical protein